MFDVSSRDNPNEPEEEEQGGFDFGVSWFEAKSRDNAAPMGPMITPREFIGDPANLRIVTKVNGVTKQDGNSKDMIHNEAYLLRHATSILTLYPGDVLATGTPAGVGSAKEPPEFLSPGDEVEMWIEGIGTMVTPIE
jgi:2-keto-4-pentenoate hydratase/2-oxohepta-3-ene-1,7-dioic acid hydratase in catechol pathway